MAGKALGAGVSVVTIATSRFWTDINSDIAQSLSAEQRAEIERVLALSGAPRPSTIGDIRLSFYFFFLRIMWGREKRSYDRLKQEQALYPAVTKRNIPAILTMGIAYTAFWYMIVGLGAYMFTDFIIG